MSNKVKMQDLSISNFDQMLKVDGVKGGYCNSWLGFISRTPFKPRFPGELELKCVYDPVSGSWYWSHPGMLRRR